MKKLLAVLALSLFGCFHAPPVYSQENCLVETEQALDAEVGKPRHWYVTDFPLTVHALNGSAEQQKALRAALEYWNAQIGKPVFRWGTKGKNVIPVSFQKIEILPGKQIAGFGPSSVDVAGHMVYALVLIDNTLPEKVLPTVVIHELGHVLGLAHDEDNELSMMHPTGLGFVLWPNDLAFVRSQLQECNHARQP